MVTATLLPSKKGRDELQQAGLPLAAPVVLRMLIDTGANETSIEEDAIQAWGLSYSGLGWGSSMGSRRVSLKRYELSVVVSSPNNLASWEIEPLMVTGWKTRFNNGAYQGCIGRDVLDRALFVYNGALNNYTLAF